MRNTTALSLLASLMFCSPFAANAQDGGGAPSSEAAASAVVATDDVTGARALSQGLFAEVARIMNDPETSRPEKYDLFYEALDAGASLDGIGRLVLGGARRSMTPEQEERYAAAFPRYLSRQYADEFANVSETPLEILQARAVSKRDVIVRSNVVRHDGSKASVDWRVRRLRSGDQKLIDIIVSGVSLVILRRDEFSSFIDANGVEALIQKLEEEAA